MSIPLTNASTGFARTTTALRRFTLTSDTLFPRAMTVGSSSGILGRASLSESYQCRVRVFGGLRCGTTEYTFCYPEGARRSLSFCRFGPRKCSHVVLSAIMYPFIVVSSSTCHCYTCIPTPCRHRAPRYNRTRMDPAESVRAGTVGPKRSSARARRLNASFVPNMGTSVSTSSISRENGAVHPYKAEE